MTNSRTQLVLIFSLMSHPPAFQRTCFKYFLNFTRKSSWQGFHMFILLSLILIPITSVSLPDASTGTMQ